MTAKLVPLKDLAVREPILSYLFLAFELIFLEPIAVNPNFLLVVTLFSSLQQHYTLVKVQLGVYSVA